MVQTIFDKQKYPIMFMFIFLPLILAGMIDNDVWWLLALGKVCLSGLPTSEPLTLHSDYDYIAQQWLSASGMRLIYDALGFAGLAIVFMLLSALIIYLIYKLTLKFSGKYTTTCLCCMFAGFAMCPYFVTRPQIFSYIIFLSEVCLLETYAQNGNYKALMPIPFLSILEINLHASMWLMMFVLTLPYIAESVALKISRSKKAKLRVRQMGELCRDYKLYPILIMLAGIFLCGFVNPYGFEMMTYLFRSYGVDIFNKSIQEMMSITWNSGSDKVTLIILIVSLIIISARKKKMPISYYCLFAGTFFLSLTARKGFAYFIMFATPVVCTTLKDVSVKGLECFTEKAMRKQKIIAASMISCIILLVSCGLYQKYNNCDLWVDDNLKETREYIEENLIIDKDKPIYTSFNNGGYFEFYGYKTYIDARAEVYLKENNHKEDCFEEFVSVEKNTTDIREFLKKYDFEVLIVPVGTGFHRWLVENNGAGIYVAKYASTDDDQYTVWAKESSVL